MDSMYANRKISNWEGFSENPVPTSTLHGVVKVEGTLNDGTTHHDAYFKYSIVKAHGCNMSAYIHLHERHPLLNKSTEALSCMTQGSGTLINFGDKECIGWDYSLRRLYDKDRNEYRAPPEDLVMEEVRSVAKWICDNHKTFEIFDSGKKGYPAE